MVNLQTSDGAINQFWDKRRRPINTKTHVCRQPRLCLGRYTSSVTVVFSARPPHQKNVRIDRLINSLLRPMWTFLATWSTNSQICHFRPVEIDLYCLLDMRSCWNVNTFLLYDLTASLASVKYIYCYAVFTVVLRKNLNLNLNNLLTRAVKDIYVIFFLFILYGIYIERPLSFDHELVQDQDYKQHTHSLGSSHVVTRAPSWAL